MADRIASFKDLTVYKLSFELQQEIFAITKSFPREEKYALTDQVRRASRAIGANLSEAWQKRRYMPHFVSKLTDADGEQSETEHWIDTALACGYIKKAEYEQLKSKLRSIGRMLGTMISKPEKFCHPSK